METMERAAMADRPFMVDYTTPDKLVFGITVQWENRCPARQGRRDLFLAGRCRRARRQRVGFSCMGQGTRDTLGMTLLAAALLPGCATSAVTTATAIRTTGRLNSEGAFPLTRQKAGFVGMPPQDMTVTVARCPAEIALDESGSREFRLDAQSEESVSPGI